MLELRRHQSELKKVLKSNNARTVVAYASPGSGKCLGIGTPVMLSNGSIVNVEDVVVGDELMGPDSTPRKVLSLSRGRGPLYRVTPVKGDSYVVNENHILSLKKLDKHFIHRNQRFLYNKRIVNISVVDYLLMNDQWRHHAKAWRVGVTNFANNVDDCDLKIPPYILGVWLGDGSTGGPVITSMDKEIIREWVDYAHSVSTTVNLSAAKGRAVSLRMSIGHPGPGHKNPFYHEIRSYGIDKNKRVPKDYLTGSELCRYEVLAGLLDTDGHLNNGYFDIVQKSKGLADDILFLARSLGLAAYSKTVKKKCCNNGVVGDYHRISIAGNVNLIPTKLPRKMANIRRQKKDVLVAGISVKPIGDGDYFGFSLDCDQLFLLGDFTVTHNSLLPVIAAAQTGLKVCWVVPRLALQRQAEEAFVNPVFRNGIPHSITIRKSTNEVNPCRGLGGYSTTYQAIDTHPELHLNEFKKQRYLLVLDEFHHVLVGSSWEKNIEPLVNAAEKVLLMTGTMETARGKRIAFVPYDLTGKIDISLLSDGALIYYGRNEALKAGAIKDLEIELVDCDAKWSRDEENYSVDSLADAGPQSRDALFTALHTEFAAELLTLAVADWRVRRLVDLDSRLLIVAPYIKQAREYHRVLRNMGVKAKVATSDDSGAAQEAIIAFKAGRCMVLVTVAMAYEGLDVPGITHIACLTHIRSKPWIEQMLARAARINPKAPAGSKGKVFAPRDRMFAEAWNAIQSEENAPVLPPSEEKECGESECDELLGSNIIPLASSVTSHSVPEMVLEEASVEIETPSDAERRLKTAIEGMVRQRAVRSGEKEMAINRKLMKTFGGRRRSEMQGKELQKLHDFCLKHL